MGRARIGCMSKAVRRLFTQFQPTHYTLDLLPDRDTMDFTGTVTITGRKVGRPSQRLTFHQNGLKITSAEITHHDKKGTKTIPVDRLNHHQSYNEIRLHASHMLYPGEYTITMTFTGTITRAMNGIYPCFYKHRGKDKMLIATQFESHHAREAFPCIDEPEAKAIFQLTLTTPSGETVLSNTPIQKQATSNQQQIITFEPTPKMSTYLLAFVYGELQSVSGKTAAGVTVSTWATVAQPKSHLQYANKEAIAVLNFLVDYFGMPFPLPKIDQVALPDFDSLAMENWGLITFREVGLLVDPVNRSISSERLVTMVVAHELSHQWFGNLVTMRWWDDLWLNESFASIMESLVPDNLHPDWLEWEDFTSGRVLGAANRDVYKDVQPVGVRVSHPDEILSLFDPSIVYAKGARVLKMLFDYIGEADFRKGLQSYFTKYAYQNTERGDLWRELGTASGQNVSALMTPWIEQSGTPLLTVKKIAAGVELSQQRFLLDSEDKQTVWPIPLLATQPLKPHLMTTQTLLAHPKHPNNAVIFNPKGSGHFITHYEDEAVRAEVKQAIIERTLESEGRIIALNDLLLQAQKGTVMLTELLELVQTCQDEERDAVWTVLIRVINSAQTLTDGNDNVEKAIRAFKRTLAATWYHRLDWDDKAGDDTNTKHLRTTALALTLAGEDPKALDEALRRFAQAGSVERLAAEHRPLIASTAVRFGKASVVTQLMKEYLSTANPDVQSSITAALCATRDQKVAQRIVSWGMEDFEVIRPQDIDHWFAYLLSNRYTREVAWQWLLDNWARLIKVFGEGKKMEYFIWYASRAMTTPEWQARYHEFFEPKMKDQSLKRNIQISLAEIAARLSWREREEAALKQFFGV